MTRSQKSELKKYVEKSKDIIKNTTGRAAGLTWEKLLEIRVLLFEGQMQKYVFQSMNIPKSTWERWKQNGQEILIALNEKKKKFNKLTDKEYRYLYLSYLISVGKAKAVNKHLKNVIKAGEVDWRASKWYLEIVDNEQFGQKTESTIKGELTLSTLMKKYIERKKLTQ